MLGNDLYTVTIETVNDFIKTSRVLLVPATSKEVADFKVTQYLIDLNWPLALAHNDGRNWYISQPLEKINLLALMSSSGAVRLGKDVDVPLKAHVPTPEVSLALEQEDDTAPEPAPVDICYNCLETSCFDCVFWDEEW